MSTAIYFALIVRPGTTINKTSHAGYTFCFLDDALYSRPGVIEHSTLRLKCATIPLPTTFQSELVIRPATNMTSAARKRSPICRSDNTTRCNHKGHGPKCTNHRSGCMAYYRVCNHLSDFRRPRRCRCIANSLPSCGKSSSKGSTQLHKHTDRQQLGTALSDVLGHHNMHRYLSAPTTTVKDSMDIYMTIKISS